MAKIEELHERIEFLKEIIEKQKNLMYYYDRSLNAKLRSKEIYQTDKQIEMDKAYLDHLKEIQNIVIMRKSERGWSKYE